MFKFVPALVLGGAPTLKHVAKAAVLPQLDLLVQNYDAISIE